MTTEERIIALGKLAVSKGCTLHVNFLYFHPEHTARFDTCTDRVEIKIIPITESAPFRNNRDLRGHSIESLIDVAEGVLGGHSKPAYSIYRPHVSKRSTSPEERERMSQRMRDMWAKKRAEDPSWHPRTAAS